MEEKINFFEKVIEAVLKSLPKEIRDKLDNVEFILEEFPDPTLIKENNFTNSTLLGLYVGIPLSKRGSHYNWVLPDRIYIFMEPIIQDSIVNGIPLEEKIKKVLLHEIGHYFGFGEDDLKRLGIY